MQLGIFAKTFAGTTPDTVLAAAGAAGYAAVQYNMACSGLAAMPDQISTAEAQAVAAASRVRKVSIAAVSGTYNMIHPDVRIRESGHARLEVLAARCKTLTAPLITLCTGTRDPDDQWRAHAGNDSPEAWRDLLQSMQVAIAIAERWDVNLGIEPELANVVNSAAKAAQLIRDLQSPRVKIVLDPANLFEQASLAEQRDLVSSAIDLLGGHIAMGHAKDRARDGSVVAAGKGEVDFQHYVSRLKAAGFNGPLVTHGLGSEDAAGVATFLRNVLGDAGVGL